MYEVINTTTKQTVGIFGTYAAAAEWVAKNGGADLFRIFPW